MVRTFLQAGALLVDDPLFDRHLPLAYHPERPERLTAARAAIQAADVNWTRIEPADASLEALERVHSARFVAQLESLRGKTEMVDADTFHRRAQAAKRRAWRRAWRRAGPRRW